MSNKQDYLLSIFKLQKKHFDDLNKSQAKKISAIYRKAFKESYGELKDLNNKTAQYVAKVKYTQQIADELEKMIKEGMTTLSKQDTKALKEFYEEVLGVPSSKLSETVGKMSNILNKEKVEMLVKGNIYKDGNGLSDRVWTTAQLSGTRIQDALTSCLAQGKGSAETAKILKEYGISGHKTWDRKKIAEKLGVGYARKYSGGLDYSALRLARTTNTHLRQLQTLDLPKKHPYVGGVIYHASHSDGRTCSMCKERDGQFFITSACPLDHPNGMCWLEPSYMINGKPASFKEIAQDLGKWAKGEPNSGTMDKIKEYKDIPVADRYKKKDKVNPIGIADFKTYTEKSAIRKELTPTSKEWRGNLTDNEFKAIHDYTGSLYTELNNALRTNTMTDNLQKYADDISSGLKKYTVKEDMIVWRGTGSEFLEHADLGGLDWMDIYEKIEFSDDEDTIREVRKALKGMIVHDKGFMSTTAYKNSAFDRKCMFKIEIPKGYNKGAYIESASQFANEHEFLLDKDTYLAVKSVKYDRSLRQYIFNMCPLEVK